MNKNLTILLYIIVVSSSSYAYQEFSHSLNLLAARYAKIAHCKLDEITSWTCGKDCDMFKGTKYVTPIKSDTYGV